MAHFEIYEDVPHECYRWKLIDNEDRKVAASESYLTKRNALHSAEEVVRVAPLAKIYDMTI